MSSDKLFEDYDPDMEDIFGRKDKLTPRSVVVSEAQKTDPLRKPKVMLQGVLVAEKQPLSAQQINKRMIEEDGKALNPRDFGFSTLDDLLQAMPDTVVCGRRQDGTHIYTAKMNEANQDLIELVQLQTDRGEIGRAPRSLLSNGRRGGNHGASFRNYNGPKFGEENKDKDKAQKIAARSALGPAKSAARVQNLADVLRDHRSELGVAHPDSRNPLVTLAALQNKFMEIYGLPVWGKRMTEGDLFKELDRPEFKNILQFWTNRPGGDVYVELVDSLDAPDGRVKKEETAPEAPPVQLGTVKQRPIAVVKPTPRQDPANIAQRSRTVSQMSSQLDLSLQGSDEYSRVGDESNGSEDLEHDTHSTTVLLEQDPCDGFFELGPGFTGGRNVPTPAGQSSQKTKDPLIDLATRFGANVSFQPQDPQKATLQERQMELRQTLQDQLDAKHKENMNQYHQRQKMMERFQMNSQQQRQQPAVAPRSLSTSFGGPTTSNALPPKAESVGSFGDLSENLSFEDANDVTTVDQKPPQQPRIQPNQVNITFPSRSINPVNEIKVLADYIRSRGSANYDGLPDRDRVLVDFSKNVFSVFSTQPGETLVRLADPNVDTSTLKFTSDALRDPVETDLRWMSEVHRIGRGKRFLAKPTMFVPPRGFLMVTDFDGIGTEKRVEQLETVLRTLMAQEPPRDLHRDQVRPGVQAVYIYREKGEARYYRVLILSQGQNKTDIMVLLADVDNQYFVDVDLNDLLVMPEKAGFKQYPPNLFFATLHGVMGLPEEEQKVFWKNCDDEIQKKMVVTTSTGEEGKILTIDMVWRDETGNYAWLSEIAKRRGAILSPERGDSAHLMKNPMAALIGIGTEEENVMEFYDFPSSRPSSPIRKTVPIVEKPSEIVVPGPSGFNKKSLLNVEPIPSPRRVTATTVPPTPTTVVSTPLQRLDPFSPSTCDMYQLFNKAINDKNLSLAVGLSTLVRTIQQSFRVADDWKDLADYIQITAAQMNVHL